MNIRKYTPHFMWCVFHHIYGQFRGKLWRILTKSWDCKTPLLPRQVLRLPQKVKSKWVGETHYCCPCENKIPTLSVTLRQKKTENIWSRIDIP